MNDVNIDYMLKGKGQGSLANYIMTNGRLDSGRLRPFIGADGRSYISQYKGGDPTKPESYIVAPIQTNATLRRDEWKQLDDAIMPIARERLGGIQDLIDKGLVFTLGNAMGTTVLEYHDVNDAMKAELTMDGVTRGPGDRPDFTTHYLPLPIIHVDYEINARVLAASRSLGNPLDTTSAEFATRRVAEKLEDMLFTATSYSYGNKGDDDRNTIYSYLNAPHRNEVTLSVNWDASAKTGALIIADVLNMKQASISANHYGPWMLYIPTAYETTLDEDYDTTRGNTIRERILAISGISGIKVIDRLTANNVLLVEMNTSTVRLIRGMGIQNVEWSTEGGMVTKFKIMTIQVPQIRADQANSCGVTHLAA